MKVSINWLKEYVDFDFSPEELALRLTMAGLEVEGVEQHPHQLDGIVIGRVLEVRPHEQADQLSVCDVDVGDRKLKIVCGAPNVAAGQLVPVALEGAVLAGDRRIDRREIRGVLSEGMICSEAELGISSRADTILVLDGELRPGVPAREVFGPGDILLEVNVTPNRPDCLGHLGVAREVAALARTELRKPAIELRETGPPLGERADVEIVDADRCPRYTARLIEGVQLQPSPWWLAERLEAVGVRAINNIVDVTNYVMLETGQPLHAFDFEKIAGGKIVVRRARPGEPFVTLDEKEHVLDDDVLMICDAERPVAVGGVMGGLDSEVSESTRTVLLESAYFEPTGIRRTSKKLGMVTEASRRFERGTDPNGVDYALHRAAQLIQEIAGGEVAQGFIDVYPKRFEPVRLSLRLSRIERVLGTSVPSGEAAEILSRMGFKVEANDPLQVRVPTFRPDVTREIDLIEEVARIRGYETIPETQKDRFALDKPLNWRERGVQLVRHQLVGLGFSEVLTYSMVHHEIAAAFRPQVEKVRLTNPLSEELSTLRPSLIPGLLGAIQWNVNRKRPDLRLFEIGDVFWREDRSGPVVEKTALCGAMTGKAVPRTWSTPERPLDFYDLKGVVETFFSHAGLKPVLRPGEGDVTDRQILRIELEGADIGFLGRLRSELLRRWDLEQEVFVFEIDLDELIHRLPSERLYQPVPRFPAVERDLSVVVDEGVPAGDVLDVVRSAGGDWLRAVELFDVYTGEQVPAGKKSLSFSLRFASHERTLTEEEVEERISKILADLSARFAASLR